jgi:hypothetical protein
VAAAAVSGTRYLPCWTDALVPPVKHSHFADCCPLLALGRVHLIQLQGQLQAWELPGGQAVRPAVPGNSMQGAGQRAEAAAEVQQVLLLGPLQHHHCSCGSCMCCLRVHDSVQQQLWQHLHLRWEAQVQSTQHGPPCAPQPGEPHGRHAVMWMVQLLLLLMMMMVLPPADQPQGLQPRPASHRCHWSLSCCFRFHLAGAARGCPAVPSWVGGDLPHCH